MSLKTILLTEDDFLNRRLAKKVLTNAGYRIFESRNSAEALELLKIEKIDLVILDINLGEEEQDGISLGSQIAKLYEIPFIYLTAYETPDIIERAIFTTPSSYLTKPFKNVDLITAVELAIRSYSKQASPGPHIVVRDEDYNVELPIERINYIESEGNYILIHTDEKTYKIRSTIKQIMEILPGSDFAQTHRAFVVNKNKIEKYSTRDVVINNVIIPISKNYFEK